MDDKVAKMKEGLDKLDADMTQLTSEKKRREADRDRLRGTIDEMVKVIERNEALVKSSKHTLGEKESDVVQLKKEMAEAQAKIVVLQQERGEALDSDLTAEDRELLQDLTEKLADLQPRIDELSATEEALRKKHSELTNAIANNLEKQERKLAHASESFTCVYLAITQIFLRCLIPSTSTRYYACQNAVVCSAARSQNQRKLWWWQV
jgi:chromosome segregation ATPase